MKKPDPALTDTRQIEIYLFAVWVAALLTIVPVAFAAAESPMKFRYVSAGGNCSNCAWIVAMGTIELETADYFRKFIQENGIPSAPKIVIHSPGGNLIGGLLLGDLFRNFEADVWVGESHFRETGELVYAYDLS